MHHNTVPRTIDCAYDNSPGLLSVALVISSTFLCCLCDPSALLGVDPITLKYHQVGVRSLNTCRCGLFKNIFIKNVSGAQRNGIKVRHYFAHRQH